jgi:hypothetical protein
MRDAQEVGGRRNTSIIVLVGLTAVFCVACSLRWTWQSVGQACALLLSFLRSKRAARPRRYRDSKGPAEKNVRQRSVGPMGLPNTHRI